MKNTKQTNHHVYQLIVLPNTGIQICREFATSLKPADQHWDKLKKLAAQVSTKQAKNEVIRLIKDHIACNQEIESADRTDWIACDINEFVFFRLTRTGEEIHLDLVIDTQNGAGAQVKNKIPVLLETGFFLFRKLPVLLETGFFLFRKRRHLADIYVEEHAKARNETGSLIMDFGNSGSSFIFSKNGAGPLQARIVQATNPFDPRYQERPDNQRNILRSNMIVLRVDRKEADAPWIVMGDRAEELINEAPMATYLYAPKKYVRRWQEHLKADEPTMKFRGLVGQRDGLSPMLEFVQHTLNQMFQQVLSSLTNPHSVSDAPEFYPQIARFMLTYPLTWREMDKTLFKEMVEKAAAQILVQEKAIKDQFVVELICSEPVAVAAYVLWETLFHFGTDNLALTASSMGNMHGTPELRMLVVDIGGGSTDIACVDIQWAVKSEDKSVDVSFKMIESMRFNRAGDRLSHIIATAIHEYIREKYGIQESLDFKKNSKNREFTIAYKRKAVSKISELAEAAKAALASEEAQWVLKPRDEYNLIRAFEPLEDKRELIRAFELEFFGVGEDQVEQEEPLMLTIEMLKAWVEADTQSLETNGEPGFMDIFLYLEELCDNLSADQRTPHIVILSGRSTRLPFIKDMIVESTQLPPHRIRTLDQILPDSLKLLGFENMDKLAVVCGAQRFRFGDHVRFATLADEPIFNRYIGTVLETPNGLQLNQIHIRPGDSKPQTITVAVEPAVDVRIGHAFREEGVAQVIANLSNHSHTECHEVKLNILDDYSVHMSSHKKVFMSEWAPGGNDFIVDNFNDTGRIDCEPAGFLKRIVSQTRRSGSL
ncbi:MAG: hypothetical protein DRR08_01595 [Candidatus Parabeggiatoa sp. nov. 2]|nr:MAG: hypothetical protein B6247_03325 [Beggiatoa sp. 4572_84]RKZ64141.1 MAG: hypothetical protein DRR08_01595 [Gammaproteobacteria bacterium]